MEKLISRLLRPGESPRDQGVRKRLGTLGSGVGVVVNLLLTAVKLDDMPGAELARQAGDAVSVLMIVPGDYNEETTGNVLLLRNPLSPDALVQAVRTMSHCAARMHALREKCEKLDRQLKERKVIDRAKGKLMDTLHLTEKEAHYRIQKKSMDTGRRIVDIAQEILDSEEIAC